jgi:2-oxoglutarate/2-oxoacid ferredoxin oxidoreductase subunit beta
LDIFRSDQEIRWCPGCGNYSILKQLFLVLKKIGIPKEKIVFVSGIGCSSRLPYYINTFGLHGIHGRAPTIATGLKLANPELSVWIITGDGDGLSIGVNHLIHLFRRNLNVNLLLLNNEIFGLTKGQYSSTSNIGLKTKSSPFGSIDYPINPLALALGANATFIARTIDSNPSHLRYILIEANNHIGTSFIEIYQNCNIFNDDAFYSKKIYLTHGKPLVFGLKNELGILLDGLIPKIVTLKEFSLEDLWIHDIYNITKSNILSRFFFNLNNFPRPFGIFYKENRDYYEDIFYKQINIIKYFIR